MSAPITDDPAHRLATVAIQRVLALRSEDTDADLGERLDAELDDARAALRRALADGLPLGLIARRAALDDDEAEALALLTAVETDELVQQLLVALTGDRSRHLVELWSLPELLPGVGAAAVGPAGGLQRAALITVTPSTSFARSAVRVAPRVLWALAGDRAPDPDLPPGVTTLTGGAAGPGTAPVVLVTGNDRVRRQRCALEHLHVRAALAVDAPREPAAWAAVVREATLAGFGVVVDVPGDLDTVGRGWIERATHVAWALTSREPIDLDQLPPLDWRELHADAADVGDAEWTAVVGAGPERRHRITAEQLARLERAMPLHDGDVDLAFRRLTSSKLDRLARHVRPRARWEDLVLSADRTQRLRELVDRYRTAGVVYDDWGFAASPSRGLVALFSGPSGTGKTLAAEVVAGELGLELYRMDLSAVVSKYIGETEKNLDALFDAAGMGGFVLFFDEADALFAKRGEVSDSHDRYANIETSYLLQRLETYDGVVVLATNYEKNIDQAFVRRIHARIDFAMPTETERLALWRHHLRAAPSLGEDVDLAWLVTHFDLSGAQIRNAVIDAAFLAAAAGTAIDMTALVRGVARELQKIGRLVRREAFGEWFGAATAAADTAD